MKHLFILFFLMCFASNDLFSQKKDSLIEKQFNSIHFLNIIPLGKSKNIISENTIISASQINSLEIISRFECLQRFGILSTAGASIIKLKPHSEILLFNQILEKFHLTKINISEVYINDMYVETPETIIAVGNEIVDVKVRHGSKNDNDIINIITAEYNLKKSGHSQKRNYLLNPQEVAAIQEYLKKPY